MKTIAAIVALMFAPSAHALFKCIDEQGKRHYGETPPAGCANVVMDEVTPGGHVLRRIEPTPTPEQLKVREEAARRQREAEKAAAEQARLDKALLATFASEKEIDVARDRNIEPLNGRIRSAQDRIKEIDKRLAALEAQKELYTAPKSGKAQEVPPVILADEERHRKERQTLSTSIAASEKEIAATRARFDRDRQRWVDLRSGAVSMPVADRK